MNCTILVVKTKVLISFAVTGKLIAVTAKLICAFVFGYADCWFSHAVADLLSHLLIAGCDIGVHIFVRPFVRPSVNIYVEVWFSQHQR